MIAKITCNKYQLGSIFSIQINIFNNNIYYIEKYLIKSFNDFVLFEIFKNNKLLKYILIYIITIEVIIFVFFIIIDSKIINFKIVFLISSLITLKNKKSFAFILNNFHF